MFWIIFTIGIGVIVARQTWRDEHDLAPVLVFAMYFTLLAGIMGAFMGMVVIPGIATNRAETTTVVLEDKPLQAFPDDNYIHINDIGYSTFHYTLREQVDENSYRDFTLKSNDYFQTIYADSDFHFIKSKTTFANPILKFFTYYRETNITIKIPPQSIGLEENMYKGV